MALQSHGCSGWRSCRFSCATLPSWLATHRLPYFSTACQCNGCLHAWHGGSWLGCRDCQPWECYSVQWLADWLPVEALGHPRHPTSIIIETSLLFLCKYVLISMRTASLTREKQGGFSSKQGQHQPHFHSKARQLSTQL